jgi:hypothetical protein
VLALVGALFTANGLFSFVHLPLMGPASIDVVRLPTAAVLMPVGVESAGGG